MTPTNPQKPRNQLNWKAPLETLAYQPVYLANGTFGGMVDLSGSNLCLWSPNIAATPKVQRLNVETRFPVTALKVQAFYRNAFWKREGFWIGRSGIHTPNPHYVSNPSIPHQPQVYQCRQCLDTDAGLLTTEGTLYVGAQAALEAGLYPERALPFETRLAFLKNSSVMGIEIRAEAETEVLFLPETILQEDFILRNSGKSIHSLGNEMDVNLKFSQTIIGSSFSDECIEYLIRPGHEEPYRVIIRTSGAKLESLNDTPGFLAQGTLFCTVEILPHRTKPAPTRYPQAEAFFQEQATRWQQFWQCAEVTLPASEALWQERYQTSLFYVSQSMIDGPIHPTGMSKPMTPYWYGCFHDTDTYFCRPLLETGHAEEAALHLNFRHRTLGGAKELARAHERSGALYPWQGDPLGKGEFGDVPINSAIIAIEAWHHYLYSGTDESCEKAREILGEVLLNLCDLIDFEPQPLRLKPTAVMTFSETMTACDPTEVRIGIRAVAEALLAAQHPDEKLCEFAKRISKELELPVSDAGYYCFSSSGEPAYIRCPSVTLGSFPFHYLPADSALNKTLDHELGRTAYVFSWMPHLFSIVASQLSRRAGPASAGELLRQADVFYKPWHAFDEWENRRTARAAIFVTAAGAFCSAIHAMLLAETGPGVWSLFPGIPEDWETLAFTDLRTRHGWRVSARLEGGKLIHCEAVASHADAARNCLLRFRDETYSFSNP